MVDELESSNDDDADHEIVGGESREYEREEAEAFRKWINDSRISQLDEQTEQMLLKMRRDVARHRWRRAISAVRLRNRISGGRPLKWENPAVVTVPGRGRRRRSTNRFVDMEEMMKETIRNQPRYFKDGSVMNVRSWHMVLLSCSCVILTCELYLTSFALFTLLPSYLHQHQNRIFSNQALKLSGLVTCLKMT